MAPLLSTMAEEWGGEIAIGSYPVSVLLRVLLSVLFVLLRHTADLLWGCIRRQPRRWRRRRALCRH